MTRWTDILESSGDATIGAALVRLAQRATELHLHERQRQIRHTQAAGGTGREAHVVAAATPTEARR